MINSYRQVIVSVLLSTAIWVVNAQSITYSSNIPVELHRIDLERAQGGSLGDLIDSLTYTPLEIKDRRDIFQSVFKMAMIGNSMGILSFQNPSSPKLFIYNTNGKLIRSIDYKQASGLPKSENVFNLQAWDNHFLLSSENYKIKISPTGDRIHLLSDSYIQEDSLLLNKTMWHFTRYDSITRPKAALSLNGEPLVTYTEKKTHYFMGKDNYFSPVYYPTERSYFIPENHYKIFELSEKGIEKIYDFIFPQRQIMDTSQVYHSWIDYINVKTLEDRIASLDNILRYQDYLIFRTDLGEHYAFNIENKDFISFSNIIPDTSNDFMSLTSGLQILTDGRFLYTLINPYQVLEAEEISRMEKHDMSPEFHRLKNQYNPILVRFKLKQ